MTHATVPGDLAIPRDPTYLAVASYLSRYGNPVTREVYRIHLKIFLDWCTEHDLRPLLDVQRPHVELFGRYLEEIRGNSAATVAARLSCVRGFYNTCEIDGLVQRNPAAHIRLPKVWHDETRLLGLSRTEMMIFMRTAENHPDPNRWALAALLGHCGLRVSEACSILIEWFRGRNERGYQVLSFTGKGNKPATTLLTVPVQRALAAAAGDRTRGPLLHRADGKQLDRRTAHRWIEQLGRRAGIEKHVTPHTLRRSYVTLALDAGVPLRDVQYGARHEDPRVTMRYDRARGQLDRHANHYLSAYIAGSA